MGRPTDYTQEIADKICELLMDGEPLRKICKHKDMPHRATVHRWLPKHDEFRDQYERARTEQAEALADDIVDIADNDDPEADVQRDRLRIDARKWVAMKLKPKKYGDRIHTEHSGKVDMTGLSDEELQLRVLQAQRDLKNSEAD